MVDKLAWERIKRELDARGVTLIAVSKTKPESDIQELYDLGQRDFGENYVQELADKQKQLPIDIRWHFIGHLQTNKVKYIASFIHLVQSVDSLKLLTEINKQAVKHDRKIDCLLQVHIADEETKFGFDEEELKTLFSSGFSELKNICISGFMGMASLTDDENKIRTEFKKLKTIFDAYQKLETENSKQETANSKLQTLSMGMSSDYKIAIEEGTTMVRIGSMLFGERIYNK